MHSTRWVGRVALVLCLVCVTVGGGVAGQELPPPWAAATAGDLELIVADHNAVVAGADLGPAAALLRNERVVLHVSDVDGTATSFAFRTDTALRVVDFRAGTRDDATVRVFTDRATVSRIADAPDRVAASRAAVRAGDIRIVGVGPVNGLLWWLVGLALWATASAVRAAAVGAVALVGVGVLAVAGAKLVGGGVVTAAGATGGTSGAGGAAGASGSNGSVTSGSTSTATGATTADPTSAASPTAASDASGNAIQSGLSGTDPVGIADRVLSFFERLLFVVTIAKKLGGQLSRRVGTTVERLLRRLGFVRADGEESASAVTDDSPAQSRPRRRPVPRRRRRRE